MKTLTLGIFGFGCVGQGLYEILQKTQNPQFKIKRIAIKDESKSRSIPKKWFTTQKEDLLNDPEIDVIVELIDDADDALKIVQQAMQKGKAVVSANKKMIAENLPSLLSWQQQYQVPFLYEGACCASIPIIRNLEEYYDHDWLNRVRGIVNGSTNYVLTQMVEQHQDFDQSLRQAQDLGFAESDPTLDVEAFDPVYKLSILVYHSFGLLIDPKEIARQGIHHLAPFDLEYARKNGLDIKLLAYAEKRDSKVSAWCFPTLVPAGSRLAQVSNEYNAVELESHFSDTQLLLGKGAGDTPTGTAVLSDISALCYGYQYAYKKARNVQQDLTFELDFEVEVYLSYQYIEPDFSAFSDVKEHLKSDQGNYVIGTIRMDILQAASWRNAPGISLLLFQ